MFIFFDTNVLLSSASSNGLCQTLTIELAQKKTVGGITSERVFAKFSRILESKFKWPSYHTQDACKTFRQILSVATPATKPISHCPDPDDAWILADAINAECNLFVTGDKALLQMEAISRNADRKRNTVISEAMRIVPPRTCLEILLRRR